MTINSAEFDVRTIKVVGPADRVIPHTSVVNEPAGPNNLDGEIITRTVSSNFDIHGSPITPESILVYCSAAKVPVNIFNAFQCAGCQSYFSTFFMAEEIVPDPADPAAATKLALRRGVCKSCFENSKWKRRFRSCLHGVTLVSKVVFAPFLPNAPVKPGMPK